MIQIRTIATFGQNQVWNKLLLELTFFFFGNIVILWIFYSIISIWETILHPDIPPAPSQALHLSVKPLKILLEKITQIPLHSFLTNQSSTNLLSLTFKHSLLHRNASMSLARYYSNIIPFSKWEVRPVSLLDLAWLMNLGKLKFSKIGKIFKSASMRSV